MRIDTATPAPGQVAAAVPMPTEPMSAPLSVSAPMPAGLAPVSVPMPAVPASVSAPVPEVTVSVPVPAAAPTPAARTSSRPRRQSTAVLIAAERPADQAAWRRAVSEPFAALETGNLAGMRALLQALQPSVAMLDVALLGMQGAASLPALRRLSPDTRFIVLGAFASDEDEMAIYRAGARACCDPGIPIDLLARAVDAVMRGEVWIRRALTARLLDEAVGRDGGAAGSRGSRSRRFSRIRGLTLAGLTAREREIATLVARGDSNKRIAQQLSITERTVKAHLTEIFRKSGVGDRVKLALLLSGSAAH